MEALDRKFFRYLPVSRRDEQWGLCVVGGGCTGVPPHSHYPAMAHPPKYDLGWSKGRILPDEYQIIYITRGRGVFESSTTHNIQVLAGNIILLFPGVWHRYQPADETGWDEWYVCLKGEILDRLVAAGFFGPRQPVIDIGLIPEVHAGFVRIVDAIEIQPLGFEQIVASEALLILSLINAAMMKKAGGGSHVETVIRQAKCIMMENMNHPLDIEDLARQLHISYAHFRQAFKHSTGFAPNQYHLQMRLNRAKELLKSTELSVKEVAGRVGFEDVYHFSKIFKKKTGLAPTEWKRS